MNGQKPSVGRIVHFYSPSMHLGTSHGLRYDTPRAALVTAVNVDGSVNLCVFEPDGGNGTAAKVHESHTPKAGHWTWPPRA